MSTVKNTKTETNFFEANIRSEITPLSWDQQRVTVKNMVECNFGLTPFEAIQIAKGAEYFTKEIEGNQVSKATFNAFVKLSNYRFELDNENKHTVVVTRDELKQFKMFLELRMQHCEEVRKKEIENNGRISLEECEASASEERFNQDTYIGQKILLINIREALLGEVVE